MLATALPGKYDLLITRPSHTQRRISMNRREFLAATAAGLAASTLGGYVAGAEQKPLRFGLIGCGWYGKSDMFRLLQIAPQVEVVSLCDVDKKMLEDCADMVASRQQSKKR